MTKEERKLYMQEYRKTQKWKISKKLSDKRYYEKNKESHKIRSQEWKLNNLERFYEINKQWNQNNPKKVKEAPKHYRKNNPHYKIRNLFHNLKKNYKNENTPEFILIKEHIDSQFTIDMNWGNTEIDHKIPISWFKKETPYSLINDLRNLHPLFKEENRKKSNSYCHSIPNDYFLEIEKYITTEERIKLVKRAVSL